MIPQEPKIITQAVKKYGRYNQTEMIIEECSELIQAIQKYKRDGSSSSKDHVCEEIADVIIMIEQAKIIFSAKRIEEFREMKILKLSNKIHTS